MTDRKNRAAAPPAQDRPAQVGPAPGDRAALRPEPAFRTMIAADIRHVGGDAFLLVLMDREPSGPERRGPEPSGQAPGGPVPDGGPPDAPPPDDPPPFAPEAWALGRFVRLRAWAGPPLGCGPLLDRPFSVHRSGPGRLELLIRRVGPATALLAGLAPGRPIRVLGPLGRGLADARPGFASERWHLAAGGAGLAPMGAILEALGGDARLHYGERTGAAQVSESFFRSLAADSAAATEDGSGYGRRGLVTGPLAESLAADPRPVLACGPPPMLAAVAALAARFSVPFLASVEARMACGLGACLTCSLPLAGGGRMRACVDGPVVEGSLLDWGGAS